MDNLSIFGWMILIVSWVIALGWTWRVAVAIPGLATMPDLLKKAVNRSAPRAGDNPVLSVVVPARNEEKAIEATLRSLFRVIGVPIEIVAVDDRSTDGTGRIMDRLAEEIKDGRTVTAHRYKVIHIDSLPAGWMGKTHAMATGARADDCAMAVVHRWRREVSRGFAGARADLCGSCGGGPPCAFSDFDFAQSRRTHDDWISAGIRGVVLAAMESSRPECAARFSRHWRVQYDPQETYESIRGFEALRMEVLEDLRLGYEVKKRKFRQHVVFGHNLLRIHWAEGAMGIVNNLTKNAFAIFRFHLRLIVAAMVGVALLCVMPLLGLFFIQSGGLWVVVPSVVILLALAAMYEFYKRYTGTSAFMRSHFPLPHAYFFMRWGSR